MDSSDVTSVLRYFDFSKNAYSLSTITKKLNKDLNYEVDNRHTKSLLIKHYGDKLCFTYFKDQSLPQIVYGSSIDVSDIIEGRLRQQDPLKECAELLTEEIKQFGFGLEGTLCLPGDCNLSLQNYKHDRPSQWMEFVSHFFPGRTRGDAWHLKFDTLYQFIWHWITGKMTPIHIAITETIHCLSKSREMIDIFTKLGYSISYDTMKRFDVDIAHMITEKAGENRCPVSDTIKSNNPIMGAIDNFNHKERTNTGGDTADDTVILLMTPFFLIMQNDENIFPDNHQGDKTFSVRRAIKAVDRRRNLETTLPYQKLLMSQLTKKKQVIYQTALRQKLMLNTMGTYPKR